METRHWIGLIGGIALCMLGMPASATVLQPEHCDNCTEQGHSFDFSWWDHLFNQHRSGNHGGDFRTLLYNLFRKPASHDWNVYQPVGKMPVDNDCHYYAGKAGMCNGKEVPEPGILGLLGIGLVGMVLAHRRRKMT